MHKFRFTEGTYASSIIYYVALSVVFPWRSLDLIPGSHTMILRTIRDLKDEKFLIVSGHGSQKSIKLTKKALDFLDDIQPGLYDYYMFNSENHTFRGTAAGDKTTQLQQLARKHSIAEIYCMCQMVNFRLLFIEKPSLKLKYDHTDLSEWLDRPLFYNSREVKNIEEEQRHKTEFSRIAGLIVSQGGCYNVYNIHNGLIKWNQYGENKAKTLTSDVINANFSNVFSDRFSLYKTDSAIMFAGSFSAAALFLSSKGSRPDGNGFELISFDNTYPDIYLIPIDVYGALQLKIITSPNWHERLMTCLFGESLSDFNSPVDCDNFENGKYILSLLDGNIGRLKRFNQSIYEKGPSMFEIICFPWQTETIKQILDFDIKIIEIDTEELISSFFS